MNESQAMTRAITACPSLVRMDMAEQALTALIEWRTADREYGTHSDDGWLALYKLRDAADRIESLTHKIGEPA